LELKKREFKSVDAPQEPQPVQEESRRSDDLERRRPKPEQLNAPTATTMTARVVFHYAIRSFLKFWVIYALTLRMSSEKSLSVKKY